MKCRHGHEAGVSAEPDCAPCVIYAMSEEVDGLKAKLAAGEEWAEKARAQIASDQLDLARLTREVERLKTENAKLDIAAHGGLPAYLQDTPTPCKECGGGGIDPRVAAKLTYSSPEEIVNARLDHPCPSCAGGK